MFCQNCGKKITDDVKFCEGCGLHVKLDKNADFSGQSTGSYYSSQDYTNTNPNVNDKTAYNIGFGFGNQKASNNQTYTAVPIKNKKRLWSKGVIFAIIGVVIAISIAITAFMIGFGAISSYTHNRIRSNSKNMFGNHNGIYGNQSPWEQFNEGDSDEYYYGFGSGNSGNYGFGNGDGSGNGSGRGGNYGFDNGDGSRNGNGAYGFGGGGGYGNSDGSIQASPLPSDSLPTDKNGKTPADDGYEWPTGDGQYEFYIKSTIPKFESVTGKNMIDNEDDNQGNLYYIYDLDKDAYDKYIKMLDEKGFKQSEFEVEGKNSYVVYEKDYEYLIIYLMYTDNQIVVMA